MHQCSSVEKHIFDQQSIKEKTSHIPYIVLDNFPQLGLITSLRFLVWTSEIPEGVLVCLLEKLQNISLNGRIIY